MRRALLLLPLAAGVSLGLIVSAQGAEGITNGGFENGGAGWTPQVYAGFCTSACEAPDSAHAGTTWARIGGGTYDGTLSSKVGQVVQDINVPAAGTVTFFLRITPGSNAAADTFRVFLDSNVEVKSIPATTAGYASFAQVSVDLSAYPGPHTLKLYGQTFSFGGPFTKFDIDDVSMVVPDPPPSSTSSTDSSTTSTTTTTTTTTTENTPPPPTCAGKTATITGTEGTEIVTGSPDADVIVAGDGDDVVRAGAGNDVVCGGAGNDELKGASGRDRLLGETGRDRLNGGGGTGDRCDGGPSRDKATQSCEKAKRL